MKVHKKHSLFCTVLLITVLLNSAFSAMASEDILSEDATTINQEILSPEAEASPEIKIEFKDGENVIDSLSVPKGSKVDRIPVSDGNGHEIKGWLKDGVMYTDLENLVATEDAVYFVWQAPTVKDHLPYMKGAAGAFRPWDYLSRAEFCDILCAIYELPDNGCKSIYTDVKAGITPYAESIGYATASGMMSGYYDGTFRPESPISKAELICALLKPYNIPDYGRSFEDTKGHWAGRVIEYAYIKGWAKPYSESTFRPDDPIARKDAAILINRFLERSSFNSKNAMRYNNINPFYDVQPEADYYCDVMEATVPHKKTGSGSNETWYDFTYIKSGFSRSSVNVNGRNLSLDSNGQFCAFTPNTFATSAGKVYYISSDGNIDTTSVGAQEINGSLYYFNEDHSVVQNAHIGHAYFGADGRYTTGNAQMDTLVENALAACTVPGMNRYEKLRASYLYLRDNCKYLSRAHHPRGSDAFVMESAEFMFRNMRGNCYCFASCFLLMARRLGYTDAYVVSGGVGTKNSDHAWVMIGGNIYDPELEYAYRYRYAVKKDYNLFDMPRKGVPFPYIFP